MRLLLDTHVAIAVLQNQADTLSPLFQHALAADGNELHVSVATLWEIAIKWRLGKLKLIVALEDLPALIESMGMRLLAIEASHVLASADPEPRTRDPFDRLLVAKCRVEGMQLVTADRALRTHPVALKAEPVN